MQTVWLEPRLRKNIDWLLLVSVVLLMGFSLLAVHGATIHDKNGMGSVVRQAAYFGLGAGLLALVATRDYSGVTRYTSVLYWLNIALLLLVRVIGHQDAVKGAMTKGSARWIPLIFGFKLQPSEFAKVCIILVLAVYLVRLGGRIREFPTLLKTLAFVGLPMGLIIKQPDLGTGLVVGAIWFGMVYLAGANVRHLAAILAAAVGVFALGWKFHKFEDYQIDRVMVLFGQVSDPDKTYQMRQSLTAIGGGQVTGQGLRQGMQTNGDFVPENHTDFIFTVVGEELGFVGACLLIAIYALLLSRGVAAIAESEDPLGRLIAGGVVTMIGFHVVVNIAMNCGIAPVVGVPLPLMSFGGSAAWTNLAAIGLLVAVQLRRRKLQF